MFDILLCMRDTRERFGVEKGYEKGLRCFKTHSSLSLMLVMAAMHACEQWSHCQGLVHSTAIQSIEWPLQQLRLQIIQSDPPHCSAFRRAETRQCMGVRGLYS